MAIGNMDLYRALKEAGATDEAAIQAAKSVAGQLPRFWALTGTLAMVAALTLGLVWLQMQAVQRLAALEERFSGFEQRVSGLDQRVAELDERVARQHAEVMQQLRLLVRERTGTEG